MQMTAVSSGSISSNSAASMATLSQPIAFIWSRTICFADQILTVGVFDKFICRQSLCLHLSLVLVVSQKLHISALTCFNNALTVWCLLSVETDREDRIWQQRRNARDPLKTIRHKLTFIRFKQPRLQSRSVLFSCTYRGFVSWFLSKDPANSERENKNSSISQDTLISKCRSFSTVSSTAGAITSYIFCKMVSALIFCSHRSTKRVDKCHLRHTALQ